LTAAPDPTAEPGGRVQRPAVDVVIPFAGTELEFEQLIVRASRLALRPSDTVVVVDNRRRASPLTRQGSTSGVRTLAAPERRSSYHARNRGAAAGCAPWLLFLDADVDWQENLIDAYFESDPGERVAVLAGGVADAPLGGRSRATLAERYAAAVGPMGHANTTDAFGRPPYAQTANCLVRRAAFESVGAFAGGIRSGGDADLCFRLQAEGWTVEVRQAAAVTHRNRRALVALLAQKARHGAGAAWLQRRYPGSFPPRRLAGSAAWSARSLLAARRRGAGAVSLAVVDALAVCAFELGRRLPNRTRRSRTRPRR